MQIAGAHKKKSQTRRLYIRGKNTKNLRKSRRSVKTALMSLEYDRQKCQGGQKSHNKTAPGELLA